VLFCSDGNFTAFVDDLVRAGADGFIFEPVTSLDVIVERYGQTHVVVGNADCRILARGNREEIRAEVLRCARLGRNCPGYFFAVGNHIPFDVPLENVLYYLDLTREMGRR
jgi:uroporphyrinogen-III decarboxylase